MAFDALVGAKEQSWDYEEEITVIDEETIVDEIIVEDEQTIWTEYTTEKPVPLAKIQQGLSPPQIASTQATSAGLLVDKTPEWEDRKKRGKGSGKSSRKSVTSKGSVQKTSLQSFLTVDAILSAKQRYRF